MLRVFADNDVLLDAAHWGFLDHIPTLTGADWSSIAVLDSLRHRARRRDPRLFSCDRVAEELSLLLKKTVAPEPIEPSVISELEDVSGLDGGEIVLIAAFIQWISQGQAIFLTGDKRAIRALAKPEIIHVGAKLQGCVLTREHLLQHVLDAQGAEFLASGVNQARGRDIATDCIVPSPAHVSEANIRVGLASYMNDLAAVAGSLLHR